MPKTPNPNTKILKDLNAQLKSLQAELTIAQKLEGKDEYITVKTGKDQARFERVKIDGAKDKAFGNFFITLDITAKTVPVFIPLSISSGKNQSGFMYQIEGTGEGAIGTANASVRGAGVTQVTVGTLLFAKITPNTTATFRLQVHIKGNIGKTYNVLITRINYKLAITDARYQQYLKPLKSDRVKFS